MTKIDREVFVASGAKGGAVTGETKSRGSKAYYKALAAKATAARQAKARKGRKK